MRRVFLIGGWLAAGVATAAGAADKTPCAAGMVCASVPATVGAALMKAGYQGLISKDKEGDPQIESAATGYKFWVDFYGCENHAACDSLQFYASFIDDTPRSLAFANGWNQSRRFMAMSIRPDHRIELRYDVSTTGGLTTANFADVIDWFTSRLGAYDKYLRETDAAAAPAKPAAAAAAAPKS